MGEYRWIKMKFPYRVGFENVTNEHCTRYLQPDTCHRLFIKGDDSDGVIDIDGSCIVNADL